MASPCRHRSATIHSSSSREHHKDMQILKCLERFHVIHKTCQMNAFECGMRNCALHKCDNCREFPNKKCFTFFRAFKHIKHLCWWKAASVMTYALILSFRCQHVKTTEKRWKVIIIVEGDVGCHSFKIRRPWRSIEKTTNKEWMSETLKRTLYLSPSTLLKFHSYRIERRPSENLVLFKFN